MRRQPPLSRASRGLRGTVDRLAKQPFEKLAVSSGRTDRVGYSLPVSSGVAVTRITRGPFVGSDHFPVVADLQLGG